ncbi:hypothetical protein [Pedobacter sp. SYP-B3415]|uniref:hypothetical protein n=1 Tax=Pedobacter sp. SYP-B3415 TaxID=2496641 RepID=UPI00101D83E8|nr:hypothetical protein [Pedobacter sp. SYP-B3415]
MKHNKYHTTDKYGATDDDYEYSGNASRSPWTPLIFSFLLAAALLVVAYLRYHDLRDWEITGGTIRMYSIEKLCYDIGGPLVMPIFLAICAVILISAGIKQFRHRRRLSQL